MTSTDYISTITLLENKWCWYCNYYMVKRCV